MLRTAGKKTAKRKPLAQNGKVKTNPTSEETYRSIKDGEVKITDYWRKLEKLYHKALADD